jgi:hypothetical protein
MKSSYDKSFFVAGILALVFAIVLTIQGHSLKLPATPMGILDLEFAKNENRVDEVVNAWQFRSLTALWNVLIDFAFLATYGYFFSKTMKYLSAGGSRSFWYRYYPLLNKLAWAPSWLDAIENAIMLGWLLRFVPAGSPIVVFWLVCVKFALAAILAIIALPAWGYNFYRRFKPIQ